MLILLCRCEGGLDAIQIRAQLTRHAPDLASSLREFLIINDPDVPGAGQRQQLPLMRLVLSRFDVAHFAQLYQRLLDPAYGLPYYSQHNAWRKGLLDYEGRVYRVFVRAHARTPSMHHSGKYFSYAVRVRGGEQIRGQRRFSLIIRNHMKAEKQLVYQLADHFEVMHSREKLVRVKINNWDEKLYYFSDRVGNKYLESIGRSSGFFLDNDVEPLESRNKSSLHWKQWSRGSSLLDSERTSQRFQELDDRARLTVRGRYAEANSAIRSGRPALSHAFFDTEYAARFDAFRMLAGLRGHFALPANLYAFLDRADGRYYPMVTRDANMSKLQVPEPGSTIEAALDHFADHDLPLFAYWSRDDGIRQRKYAHLHRVLTGHAGDIIGAQLAALRAYERLSYLGWAQSGLRAIGALHDDFVAHNVVQIREMLSAATPTVRYDVEDDCLRIELAPHSMSGLALERLSLPIVAGGTTKLSVPKGTVVEVDIEVIVEQPGSTPSREAIRRVARVRVRDGAVDLAPMLKSLRFFDGIALDGKRIAGVSQLTVRVVGLAVGAVAGAPLVRLRNDITGEAIPAIRSVAATLTWPPLANVQAVDHAWHQVQNRLPGLRISEGKPGVAILGPGVHRIDRDLILPSDRSLRIEAGAVLELGADVLMLSFGDFVVAGTSEQPVVIRAADPQKPFGSFAVLGERRGEANIAHLHISGGRDRWFNGAYFSGALALHFHRQVRIRDSVIRDNHADDGLNVKYSRVLLERVLLRGNAADQVDLDSCDGVVIDCEFINDAQQDDNGDGLDLSACHIVVASSRFIGFPDKGISSGENTRLLAYDNTFANNRYGVAVKDLSHVYVVDNIFEDNDIDIAISRKKRIFGGGHLFLGGNGKQAALKIERDKWSTVSEPMDEMPVPAQDIERHFFDGAPAEIDRFAAVSWRIEGADEDDRQGVDIYDFWLSGAADLISDAGMPDAGP